MLEVVLLSLEGVLIPVAAVAILLACYKITCIILERYGI
jgi:hypothetical protein